MMGPIGMQELLILLVLGAIPLAVVIGVVAVILVVKKKDQDQEH